MSMMTDYFGNLLNIGDVVVYSGKASKGYCGSFTEGKVSEFNHKGHSVGIDNGKIFKRSRNVINLTALGLRSRGDTDDKN